MGQTAQTGNYGEDKAAEYLLAEGFRILHRNWRAGRYELDIVARRGDTLHFVEVKCRKKRALTSPEEAITKTKFAALRKAAESYIGVYGWEGEVQFDAIAVEHSAQGDELRYIPSAMTCAW